MAKYSETTNGYEDDDDNVPQIRLLLPYPTIPANDNVINNNSDSIPNVKYNLYIFETNYDLTVQCSFSRRQKDKHRVISRLKHENWSRTFSGSPR